MKAIFDYDPVTGMIIDKQNVCVGTYAGAIPFDEEKQSSGVDDIIKLKNAGFTAEDIIAIKKVNLS